LKNSRAGLLALLALVSCAPEPAPRTPARVAATPAPAMPGVSIRKIERKDPVPLVAHIVAIDLAKAPGVLRVVAERGPDGLVAATVSRLSALNGLFLAVNASFFQVPAGKRLRVQGRALRPRVGPAAPLARRKGRDGVRGQDLQVPPPPAHGGGR
jgi:hypothetical protein